MHANSEPLRKIQPNDGSIVPPTVVEIGAGEAWLSKAFQSMGLSVLPLEYSRVERPAMPLIHVDLTLPSQRSTFLDLLASQSIWLLYVSFPLSVHEHDAHSGGVYQTYLDLLRVSLSSVQHVVVEAPLKSYLWRDPTCADIWDKLSLRAIVRPCALSPSQTQRRRLRLASASPWIQRLQSECPFHDSQPTTLREHEGQQRLPPDYAMHVAAEAAKELPPHHQPHVPSMEEWASIYQPRLHRKHQPRGQRVPPLVPEYKRCFMAPSHSAQPGCRRLPGQRGVREDKVVQEPGQDAEEHDVWWGECWTPKEYIALALDSLHPVDMGPLLPDELLHCILWLTKRSFQDSAKTWSKAARFLLQLCREHVKQDEECISALHLEVRPILQRKKLVVWEKLLQLISYPDENLIAEIKQGFKLIGKANASGVYGAEEGPPPISMDQLEHNAVWRNHALVARVASSGDLGVDARLLLGALEEFEKGWLSGPFTTMQALEEQLGRGAILNRRFPIVQGPKVRAIDDYSESSVNLAFQSVEKLSLHDADVVANFVRVLEEVCSGHIKSLVCSDGTVHQVRPHRDWKSGAQLVGTTMDLASAYKQLPVHPSQYFLTAGVLFDPEVSGPKFFYQKTLPFGAAASVAGFNRSSRSLWAIGSRLWKLPWLNFFDDYPIVLPEPLGQSGRLLAQIIMNATGWDIFTEKLRECSPSFEALGIVFKLGVWVSMHHV